MANEETQHPSSPKVGVTPSGAKGENPATADPGKTGVTSSTSENGPGHLNPSSPEDANITPGSAVEK